MRHLVTAQFPLAVKGREDEEIRIVHSNTALRKAVDGDSVADRAHCVQVGASSSDRDMLLAVVALAKEDGRRVRVACRSENELGA